MGTYQAQIETLLNENERKPHDQRYPAKKILQEIRKSGYQGRQSGVRRYVGKLRRERHQGKVYLPLAFDPGEDAQMDWGAAVVDMAGERRTEQLFVIRANYSQLGFVMVFPIQKQEAYFEGHLPAFHFFGRGSQTHQLRQSENSNCAHHGRTPAR